MVHQQAEIVKSLDEGRRYWGFVTQWTMWSDLIVVPPPLLYDEFKKTRKRFIIKIIGEYKIP